MSNMHISIEKPTRASALAALKDMREPAVWAPGAAAVVVLFLLGQSALFCALAVAVTLYLNRLWTHIQRKS